MKTSSAQTNLAIALTLFLTTVAALPAPSRAPTPKPSLLRREVEKRSHMWHDASSIGVAPVAVSVPLGSAYYASSAAGKAATTSAAAQAAQVKTTTKATTTTTKAATTTTTTVKTTTTTKPASATNTSWPQQGGLIAAGYYPDWQYDILPPTALDYNLLDLIDFAFLLPNSKNGLDWGDSTESPKLLKQLVTLAHANDTKVVISIGGWDNSNYFSTMAATATGRQTFVANIMTIVNKYDVDGVDIDWEYPGTTGADGNAVSTKDTANFLLFLKALRQQLTTSKRLSACVTQEAFIGADGSPLADVSDFASQLDAILVMNYDVWGASSTPGPNAPLSDACTNSQQPDANEKSSIAAWTAAGMPASKILMGVPAYGYISASTKTTLVHKRDVVPVPATEILERSEEVPAGLSNRDRAKFLRKRAEEKLNASPLAKRSLPPKPVSPLRRWYEEGTAKARTRRATAKRDARKAAAQELRKRGSIIVCPNNHSGKPCAGVTDQNITSIDWNPLSTNSTGVVTNSTTGVFGGSTGVTKVGTGDVSGIDGNEIYFYQLLSYGVIKWDATTSTYIGTNGYTRKWDTCSNTPFLYDVSRKVVITYDDPISLALKGNMAQTYGLQGMNVWDLSGDTSDWVLLKAWRASMGVGVKWT